MINDSYGMDTDLIIPQQLEILKLISNGQIKLDLNHSMNLQSLSVNSKDCVSIRGTCPLVSLKKVKLVCSRYLITQDNFPNLVTNVKELYIDAFGCYGVFGTLSDSTAIPCLDDVPKFTFGTYHLNFLMFQNIRRVVIETHSDRDIIFCAFPSIKGRKITVIHVCLQNGKHLKSKHNLSQRPMIVECLSGKESTEKEYKSRKWPKNTRKYLTTERLNK